MGFSAKDYREALTQKGCSSVEQNAIIRVAQKNDLSPAEATTFPTAHQSLSRQT